MTVVQGNYHGSTFTSLLLYVKLYIIRIPSWIFKHNTVYNLYCKSQGVRGLGYNMKVWTPSSNFPPPSKILKS